MISHPHGFDMRGIVSASAKDISIWYVKKHILACLDTQRICNRTEGAMVELPHNAPGTCRLYHHEMGWGGQPDGGLQHSHYLSS